MNPFLLTLLKNYNEKDMTQEEKIKHFQVWLGEKEQDFNNEEDKESARIIAGVKSMFEAIFDL